MTFEIAGSLNLFILKFQEPGDPQKAIPG